MINNIFQSGKGKRKENKEMKRNNPSDKKKLEPVD